MATNIRALTITGAVMAAITYAVIAAPVLVEVLGGQAGAII